MAAHITGYTPEWLSPPSAGFDLFKAGDRTKTPPALAKGTEYNGPSRTIAHRGTEIFVVVGNEIRWSDLLLLKDAPKDAPEGTYRVLKTPVAGQIRQLVVSPQGDYVAILGSHTVHIAALPDSSHLSVADASPLRIKTFQLGPTAHVLEQAPVVSALWHPLGYMGSCLVTVTADACVRVWELNRDSRASFDEPALALDMKKLGNATSSDQDFRASKYGTSKGFSPDSFEMEVAAACFGGNATADEHGWASMTLWVAMTEGDVYALCPLLPSKWEPSPTTIPSLSTAVVAKASAIPESDSTEEERRIVDQQQKWLSDIDAQEPLIATHVDTLATFEVYTRPANPPAIPKLQGPFYLNADSQFDVYFEEDHITDIFVIAPRVDDAALMNDEDQDDFLGHEGLSVGIVCLATAMGQVHICLDLEGVEAQWLPSKRDAFRERFDLQESVPELLLVEILDTPEVPFSCPTFTPDPTSRYAFFLNSKLFLNSVSLDSWINLLEDELSNPSDPGAPFRLDVLFDFAKTEVREILKRGTHHTEKSTAPYPACISIVDSDLGHFILTSTSTRPQALTLELPAEPSPYASFAPDHTPLALPAPELRQPYQPHETFTATSALSSFLDSATQNTKLRRADLKNQIRFSPATLQLLTDAHRVLSAETNRLGAAAADLFRRCERMRAELSEQIRQVDDISKRTEAVTGDDDAGEGTDKPRVVGKDKIDQRMETARGRSKELAKRVEAVRRRMANLGGKELSAKEEAWAEEVNALSTSLGEAEVPDQQSGTDNEGLTARIQAVNEMQRTLIRQASITSRQQTESSSPPRNDEKSDARGVLSASTSHIPADFKKQRIQQVMQLLERETALVDAVMDRLSKLKGFGNPVSSL